MCLDPTHCIVHERALWRESEHRSTNVLPFLFGLAVDGRPVHLESSCSAHEGGSVRFERLVEPGGSRRWSVRVDAASLRVHVVSGKGAALTLVALFCERQHTGWATGEGELPSPDPQLALPFEGEPVLIRSNTAVVPAER